MGCCWGSDLIAHLAHGLRCMFKAERAARQGVVRVQHGNRRADRNHRQDQRHRPQQRCSSTFQLAQRAIQWPCGSCTGGTSLGPRRLARAAFTCFPRFAAALSSRHTSQNVDGSTARIVTSECGLWQGSVGSSALTSSAKCERGYYHHLSRPPERPQQQPHRHWKGRCVRTPAT